MTRQTVAERPCGKTHGAGEHRIWTAVAPEAALSLRSHPPAGDCRHALRSEAGCPVDYHRLPFLPIGETSLGDCCPFRAAWPYVDDETDEPLGEIFTASFRAAPPQASGLWRYGRPPAVQTLLLQMLSAAELALSVGTKGRLVNTFYISS